MFQKPFWITIRFLIGFVIWTTCIHKHCNCRPDHEQGLRDDIMFLLRWLTLWPMHGFSTHFQNAHARITFRESFAFTSPQNDALYADHDPKRQCFRVSKAWFERALRSQRVKSGFQIRKGQNHDPKRLSEHDLILCEQALNLILVSSNIVGMFSSPLLSWYLFVTPLLNLVIARDAAAGYSQDSFLISDFHLEANYSQLQETIHWMWPWYD